MKKITQIKRNTPQLLNIIRREIMQLQYVQQYIDEECLEDFCVQHMIGKYFSNIGEIASQLRRDYPIFVKNHDYIPWGKIASLRNLIVHDYDGVIFTNLWEYMNHDIPKLSQYIENIMQKEFPKYHSPLEPCSSSWLQRLSRQNAAKIPQKNISNCLLSMYESASLLLQMNEKELVEHSQNTVIQQYLFSHFQNIEKNIEILRALYPEFLQTHDYLDWQNSVVLNENTFRAPYNANFFLLLDHLHHDLLILQHDLKSVLEEEYPELSKLCQFPDYAPESFKTSCKP